MKKHILSILFIISAAFFSCGKICCTPAPFPYKSIWATKYGNLWNANLVDTIKNDTVSIYGLGDVDKLKIKFYLGPGITQSAYPNGTPYVVKKYEAVYDVFITGTHNEFIYKPDTTRINMISLISLPPSELTGTFNLTLKLSNPTGNMAFDTAHVNFSNGVFILK